MKVGRNDPCPCGSGKKYKKCCSRSNVVSLHHLVQQDFEELVKHIIAFSMEKYEIPFSQFMDETLEQFEVPEDSEVYEVITWLLANWFIFSHSVDNGQTAIASFVDTHARHVKRPVLKKSLPLWKYARPYIYRVVRLDSLSEFTVQPLFRNETLKVNNFEEDPELVKDQLLLGIVVPIGEEYAFFTSYIENRFIDQEELKDTLSDLMDYHDEDDFEKLVDHYFPEVLDTFLFEGFEPTIDEYDWPSVQHKVVAEQFQFVMEEDGAIDIFIDMGIVLWVTFCKRRNPIIKNPKLYVATLHYLVDKIAFGPEAYSQSAFAEDYGVSQSSLSAKYREFEHVLHDELDKLRSNIFEGV